MELFKGIDYQLTRRKVVRLLKAARMYKRFWTSPDEPKITPSYEPRYHGNTNAINKPVESVIKKVDAELIYNRVTWALNRMPIMGRRLIEMKYLSLEEKDDIQIQEEMNIEKTKFYALQRESLCMLACALEVEEYAS